MSRVRRAPFRFEGNSFAQGGPTGASRAGECSTPRAADAANTGSRQAGSTHDERQNERSASASTTIDDARQPTGERQKANDHERSKSKVVLAIASTASGAEAREHGDERVHVTSPSAGPL